LNEDIELSLRLAALLHDADDRKYFNQTTDQPYENAVSIMTESLEDHHSA